MIKKFIKSEAKMIGWTEMRLFDTVKFINSLKYFGVKCIDKKGEESKLLNDWYKAGLNSNFSKEFLDKLLDKAAKPLFQENFLWRLFKKHFNLDLQIPWLFGNWTTAAIKRNTITTVGKQAAAKQFNGVSTSPFTAIALGVGTPSTTALGSESTTNGGSRGAATCTNETTTLTGDTARLVKLFTFTGVLVLIEEGVFDNNTSGGIMAASQTFSAVTTADTDTLQITHNLKFA